MKYMSLSRIDKISICESIHLMKSDRKLTVKDCVFYILKNDYDIVPTKNQAISLVTEYNRMKRIGRKKCEKCKKKYFKLYLYKKEMICDSCMRNYDRDGNKIDDRYTVTDDLYGNPSAMCLEN